ncbi:unnamed protein product [Arctia plantaginis]|uniref:Apoptosis-inducing factor 1, mitochondrial n=1 Tax=Arctia plantaginis TaxID=874455 RepID=A0A8S0ZJ94_ARCPL|nr:unnamed protein product [Arctia plantaginis]
MLRAVSSMYIESQALSSLEVLSSARRDVFKLFRTCSLSTQASAAQTVLSASSAGAERASPPRPRPPPPPPPPPQPPRRAWHVAATALAISASLGGFMYYRKRSDDSKGPLDVTPQPVSEAEPTADEAPPIPSSGEMFPGHVQFLLVGAGTASFAAMRAIRAARPEARVLLVGDERELPYMRPPLSKELWREPDLAERADDLDALTFRQWNGRRRPVAYEPAAFYTPVEELESRGGAAVARGWTVTRLDVARHEAELAAPGRAPVRVAYDRCLVATGLRPRRTGLLRAAAEGGRAFTLRGVRDAWRVARELRRDDVARVLVLGGGFLAAELSAALAERLSPEGRSVVQVFREEAPLASVLPRYLAQEAARRLRDSGVELRAGAEVVSSEMGERGVRLQLADGGSLEADLVLECVGSEVAEELARRSQLETHAELGGLVVNAELQARNDVFAAGDVACFYDVVLGRRRVEHHDHAVVSGRLAGENMAAVKPPQHYTHQSMFWSDLGPQLGYEAIGIIDSRLPTVGVFSADAVTSASKAVEVAAAEAQAGEPEGGAAPQPVPIALVPEPLGEGAESRSYERGVVFYLRERRIVGVLLWNLFNRMHVARQVLAQGEFDDLFEVAKLFTLHEDE